MAVNDGGSLLSRRRTVVATVLGNFVEYFDWLVYGLFAPLFATQFFPSANPVTALLATFAVFAVGMLFRPLGGILLGRFADRRGRRPALMLSIVLMGGGSVLIGITPTYDTIGLAAPVLLLVGRSAQGLSSGGEWTAAVTYLMELAPAHRKCFYGSLFAMSAASGAFVAALLGAGASALLDPATMTAWGWRVPFLAGGLFAIVLLAMRGRLAESTVFQTTVREARERGSLRAVLGTHRRAVLLSSVFIAGLATVSSTWTTVVPAFGQRIASPGAMFLVVVIVTGIVAAVQVPLGMLADRIGVRPFLAAFGLGFAIIGPYAYLSMSASFGSLLFSYGIGILFVACITAVTPTLLAAMYPPEIRASGIGITQGTTTAVLGGITPWLATYLGSHGAGGWYIAGVVVSVLAAWAAAAVASRRYVVVAKVARLHSEDERPPRRAAA